MGGGRRLLFVGYLLAIVGSMSYGLNPLFALPLYDKGLTPLSVLFYRYAFAVVGMAAMMLIERHPFRMTRRETLLTLLMGVLFSLSSLFLFLSFRYMDAGIASTILFTYPLLVVLISWLFLHERISRATLFGLLFATAGILMLYRGSDGQTLSALGVLFVLLSSLVYALYLVGVNRSCLAVMPATKLTFYAMCTGVVMWFVSLRFGSDLQPLTTPSMWINAAGLAIFPTMLSLVAITRSIHIIGSTQTSIFGALEPITALVVSVAVFHGIVTRRDCIGILLILAAVTLVIALKKKHHPTPASKA